MTIGDIMSAAVTPVKGYTEQSETNLQKVNRNKEIEEMVLQVLDAFKWNPDIDQHWLAIGRTHIEQGFMAINRAIFKPTRVEIKE